MSLAFAEWQQTVLESIPDSMIYTVDLRMLFKEGLQPLAAVQAARNRNMLHKKDSPAAPAPIVYKTGRPRLQGVKRKPLWELAYVKARVATAIFAVLAEAQTHRLEPDAVEYVREMKKRLLQD